MNKDQNINDLIDQQNSINELLDYKESVSKEMAEALQRIAEVREKILKLLK